MSQHNARLGHCEIPDYLMDVYRWAYVSERSIRFFERPWLVNAILWGQYGRLKNAAVEAVLRQSPSNILQTAAVYGSLTPELFGKMPQTSRLTVIDAVPGQLENLAAKFSSPQERLRLIQCDARSVPEPCASFDANLLFFLLHETPQKAAEQILLEAWSLLRPGGLLVLVDYDKPPLWHPARLPMSCVFAMLEPFAKNLWRKPLSKTCRELLQPKSIAKTSYFGGLYQLLALQKN